MLSVCVILRSEDRSGRGQSRLFDELVLLYRVLDLQGVLFREALVGIALKLIQRPDIHLATLNDIKRRIVVSVRNHDM